MCGHLLFLSQQQLGLFGTNFPNLGQLLLHEHTHHNPKIKAGAVGNSNSYSIGCPRLRHGAIPNSYPSNDSGLYNFCGRSVTTIY